MEKKSVHTEYAPAAIGPYSQAIDLGEMVFTSGQIPLDHNGNIPQDIGAQTTQSLQNIKAILEAAGTGMDRVVKTTVFITDMDQFAQVNEAYHAFFTQPYPARSCVQVAKLPKDVMVEIEAIALK